MPPSQKFDDLEIRCPALGHPVPFHYCRRIKDGLPCHKLADCWFQTIDIRTYMMENYSQDERERFLAPPQPKLSSIIEIARRAKLNKT